MNFVERLQSSPIVLTQGAILTRLNYEFHLSTPNSATFAHLFNPAGRDALNKIYRDYMQIVSDQSTHADENTDLACSWGCPCACRLYCS